MEKVFLDGFIKRFKRFSYFIVAISVTGFFLGCTTLDVTMPISDLESPAHQGRKTGFGLEYSGGSAKQLKLTPDASKRPPDVSATAKHEALDLFVTKPGISFFGWNRVTGTFGLVDSKTPFFRAKVSLLQGREESDPGRFAMSLSTEVSYQRAENSGSQNGVGGATGYPWKGTAEILNGKVGLSFGFQVTKKILPFVGVNYQQIQTTGTIEQSAAASDAGGHYKIQPEIGKILVYGVGIDYKVHTKVFIMPQVLMYNLKWYENDTQEVGGSLRLVYLTQ